MIDLTFELAGMAASRAQTDLIAQQSVAVLKKALEVESQAVLQLLQSMGIGNNVDVVG